MVIKVAITVLRVCPDESELILLIGELPEVQYIDGTIQVTTVQICAHWLQINCLINKLQLYCSNRTGDSMAHGKNSIEF